MRPPQKKTGVNSPDRKYQEDETRTSSMGLEGSLLLYPVGFGELGGGGGHVARAGDGAESGTTQDHGHG